MTGDEKLVDRLANVGINSTDRTATADNQQLPTEPKGSTSINGNATVKSSKQNPSTNKKAANGRQQRGNESPTVQLSKALSYILRHGTVKEGLQVRTDGYVDLNAVLARPKISKIQMNNNDVEKHSPTANDVEKIVEGNGGNEKKRFELMQDQNSNQWFIRAVQGHSIAQVTQLDHISLTLNNLYILAAQESGNDVKEEEKIPGNLPKGIEILHGTTSDAWKKIKQSGGLNRMKRNHIHLAKARPGTLNKASLSNAVISGMRASSAVILHVDMISAIRDGIPFQLASNGAVLTSGKGDTGILPLTYITRAEDGKTGDTIWERDP